MDRIEREVKRRVKAMKMKEVLLRAISKEISWIRAAQICGYTPRHMRRVREKFEVYGYDGLIDRRGSTPRRKRIPLEVVKRVLRLRKDKYFDFNVAHFHDVLSKQHKVNMSYTFLKDLLQDSGLAQKAKSRGKHRRRRERRPMEGMMAHLDGSEHAWLLLKPEEKRDLIVIQDDATNRILFGDFYEEEGTDSTFAGLDHVISKYGLFSELYTDRGSHMCFTRKAGQRPDLSVDTQVQRALKQLRINLILGNSPEARGRGERTFRTIQGRLPQELRTKGIKTWDKASHYLKTIFIPSFNKRFTVPPREKESAFVPYIGDDLKEILSKHYERTVTKDNCVAFEGMILQIPKSEFRNHFVKCTVKVYRYIDQTMAIFYGTHCLGRYSSTGHLITRKTHKKAM